MLTWTSCEAGCSTRWYYPPRPSPIGQCMTTANLSAPSETRPIRPPRVARAARRQEGTAPLAICTPCCESRAARCPPWLPLLFRRPLSVVCLCNGNDRRQRPSYVAARSQATSGRPLAGPPRKGGLSSRRRGRWFDRATCGAAERDESVPFELLLGCAGAPQADEVKAA